MKKNKKWIKVVLAIIAVIVVVCFCIERKANENYKIEEKLFASTLHEETILAETSEDDAVILTENDCKIITQFNEAIIKKYTGSASKIVINKNIVESNVVEIDSEAFSECYNLETILVDKEIIQNDLEIKDFEINEEYKNEEYVEYITTREYSDAYKTYLKLSEEEKNDLEVIPRKYDVPMNVLYSDKMQENYNVRGIEEEIPENFDLRNIIDIEVDDQGDTKICYSYPSLNAIETNLALRGVPTNSTLNNKPYYVDFSEVHQAALSFGKGGYFIAAGEDKHSQYSRYNYYGNKENNIPILGPVYESEWPVENLLLDTDKQDDISKLLDRFVTEGTLVSDKDEDKADVAKMDAALMQTKPKLYVKESVDMPSISKEEKYPQDIEKVRELELARNTIKTHIMKYGALYASINDNYIVSKDGKQQVLNSNTTNTGHSVSIIGWDDNFSKDNFPESYKPENDGAYLALNSWGEEWGENGCFWISYEDSRVEMELSGIIAVEDIAENIELKSMNINDANTEEEISSSNRIEKGSNAKVEFNFIINELVENKNEFIISVISPKGEEIYKFENGEESALESKIKVSGNSIVNNKAQILFNFDTNILEVGEYIINFEYGGEYISRVIKIITDLEFDYYKNEDGTITLSNYFGEDKNLIIPQEYLGYQVTGIGSKAFLGADIETITVYQNISTIGENIVDTSTVIYGYKETEVERYAEENENLFIDLSVDTIGESEKWIYDIATKTLTILCDLAEFNELTEMPYEYLKQIIYQVVISENSTEILQKHFSEYYNLKEIILPDTITNIGEYAFLNCTELSEIIVPSGVTVINKGTFRGCRNITDITISGEINNIYEEAFRSCNNLVNLKINVTDNYTAVLTRTFSGCNSLTNITLPSSVTSIDDYAFYGCLKLESMVIPENVTYIGEYAFAGCQTITELTIPVGVTAIKEATFWSCINLENIEILSKEINEISKDTFKNCQSLKSIIIPEKVVSIGDYAFYDCIQLENFEIPENVTNIGEYAFTGCQTITELKIPEKVTKIGKNAFNECFNLKKLTFSDNAKKLYIGESAFYSCSSLEAITLNVEELSTGSWVFYMCNNINSVTIHGNKISVGVTMFQESKNLEKVTINADNVTIGNQAFNLCRKLNKVEITANNATIGSYAFANSINLKEINAKNVISAGYQAFLNCSNLEKVELDNLTNVGDKAFSGSKINKIIKEGTTIQEVELPNIIKRAIDELDVLYANKAIELSSGTLNEENRTLTVDTNNNETLLEIEDGELKGLKFLVKVPSGTITYSEIEPTKNDIIATLHLDEGEIITNNNGENTYSFTQNGEFTFEYTDINGESKTAIAKVANIKRVASMAVKNMPIKTEYEQNEDFDSTGLIVETTYTNGDIEETSDYTVINGSNLTCLVDKIIIQHNENNEIQVKIPIEVAHELVIDEAEEATCEEEGKTEGKHCSVCNEVLVEQEIVPALGHSYTNYVSDNNATCEEDGTKTAKCDNCDKTDTITDVGSAKGHIEEIIPREEATCEEEGKTEGKRCSICKALLQPQEIIPAKGHCYSIYRFDATCEADAKRKIICEYCKKEDIVIEEGTAKGHSYTNYVSNNDATCEEDGTKTAKCDRCDKTNTITDVGSATGHTYENGVCTECGKESEELIIESEVYEINEMMISNILPETTLEEFLTKIETNAEKIEIYNKDNEVMETEEIIATGMKIRLELNDQYKEYDLAVKGDTTGDGIIDLNDAIRALQHRAGGTNPQLTGAYLKAAELTKTGQVTLNDVIKIMRYKATNGEEEL